jgi:hypothetical protein
MTSQLSSILTSTSKVFFTQGHRTYFVVYHFNGSVEQLIIHYGACVLRTKKGTVLNLTERAISDHFDTANARYSRFPVECLFTKSNEEWFPGYITRHSLQKITSCKAFNKRLVNLFCSNGVRYRPDGITSLRQAEYTHKINMLNRQLGRVLNTKQTELGNFNKNHPKHSTPRIQDDFTQDEIARLADTAEGYMIFPENRRVVHVVYSRLSNGKTIYGACFFRPSSKDEIASYNVDNHLSTAYRRMRNYGIKTTIPSSMRHNTRSTLISEHDTTAWKMLRKAVAKYGVRARRAAPENGESNFLTPHLIHTTYSTTTKNLNRVKGEVCRSFSNWTKTKAIGQ